MEQTTFRDRLRAARQKAGISQQRLADEVGQSYVTISRYESGESEPSVSHAIAIARALGTTVEAAFGDDRTDNTIKEEAMTYQAERRVQIALHDGTGRGVTHEDRGDGTPVCGQWLRDPTLVKFFELGPGTVTCGSCARSHG